MPPAHMDKPMIKEKMIISVLLAISAFLLFSVILLIWICFDGNSNKKAIFPGNAIMKAKAQRLDNENLEHEALQFGIIVTDSGKIRAKSMIARINSNPKLAEILTEARRNRVYIFVGDRFSIESGYISIDEKASDEEIIKFLTK